jgi:hypothetical protein
MPVGVDKWSLRVAPRSPLANREILECEDLAHRSLNL